MAFVEKIRKAFVEEGIEISAGTIETVKSVDSEWNRLCQKRRKEIIIGL